MRIGDLAEHTGASVRSLRYYEEQGLLLADRTPSGQRTYDDDAVDDIRSAFARRPHVFNLGHGITPDTPIPHVERLVARLRA